MPVSIAQERTPAACKSGDAPVGFDAGRLGQPVSRGSNSSREVRGGQVAVQMFARSPVLIEHETAGVSRVHVQVVLDTTLLSARRIDEAEQDPPQVVFFTGSGFQLCDDGQRLGNKSLDSHD